MVVYYNTVSSGGTSSTWAPVCKAASGGTSGDPHFVFAHGGEADIRGTHNRTYCLLSGPDLAINAHFENRTFVRYGGQLVHGTFITAIYISVRSPRSGTLVRAAVLAEQTRSFRVANATLAPAYFNATEVDFGDVLIEQIAGRRVRVRGAGWEGVFTHGYVRKPVIDDHFISDTSDRMHWQLNTKLRTLDNDRDLVAKFGRSTLGHLAPHGLIGQSFDGSSIAVSGKVDKYGFGLEMTTSAQAEGAIEGTHTDYIVDTPFSTKFKYSRFDAHGYVAPRNVSLLAGAKAAATPGAPVSASTVELHGTDMD